MTDKRITKANNVDPNRPGGWIADLSTGNAVNPDCWWHFKTRKTAARFLVLVDGGMRPEEAINELERRPSGTAPDTSLYLGQARRAWLVAQGGIQPTIAALIDREIAGE